MQTYMFVFIVHLDVQTLMVSCNQYQMKNKLQVYMICRN